MLAAQDTRDKRRAAVRRRASARTLAQRQRRTNVELATRVSAALLDAAGLPKGKVDAGRDAHLVRITVKAGDLCTAKDADETAIAQRLREALRFVAQVQIGAADARGTFAQVRRRSCGQALPPNGRETFFERSGGGPFATDIFDVVDRRWSIDYVTDGAFLQILVVDENGKLVGAGISAGPGAAASRSFKGPASFSLRIAGDGRWTVRVRAGS